MTWWELLLSVLGWMLVAALGTVILATIIVFIAALCGWKNFK